MNVLDRIPAPISGRFRLDLLRNGSVVEQIDEPNMIVMGYQNVLAGLLGGIGGAVTQVGFGSSAVPAAFGNTSLTTPYLKAVDGAAVTGLGLVTFNFSLGSGEANGLAIGEFGLLTASGTLVARKNRIAAAVAKDSTISLVGTWTVAFPGA